MLKKISLIGILVFSSFVAYSAGVPDITVDGERRSPACVCPGRGNYKEEIPMYENSRYTTSFELWLGSQVLLKFLNLMEESGEFEGYMQQNHPSLTEVLQTMKRKAPLNFLSIIVQQRGDLSPLVESVKPRALIRFDSDGFTLQDEEGEGVETVSTIASLLSNKNVLEAVLMDFSGTFLKGDMASIFGPITSSSLSAVELAYCSLGDLGEGVLSQIETAFQSNQTIAYLGLAGNHLGDDGAWAVGRILQSNNKLLLLTFGDNDVTPEGAEALAYGLQKNSTLCFLNIAFSELGDGGAWNFIELLQHNKALRKVSLVQCGITEFSQTRLQNKANGFSCSKKLEMIEPPIQIPVLEGLAAPIDDQRRRLSSSLF